MDAPGRARSAVPETPGADPLTALFAPFGLEVRAGDLSLRLLRDEDLSAYAALLRRPIFPDPEADHVFPWYAVEEERRIAEALDFQWTLRAGISPQSWHLSLGVFADGELIGVQDVSATDFGQLREVSSGSWLTRSAQGRGHGLLMRRALLVLAIDHLGARTARSSAVLGNEPSRRVSLACGYLPNGTETRLEHGRPITHQRFLLRDVDLVRPAVPVQVTGLGSRLRALLGAG